MHIGPNKNIVLYNYLTTPFSIRHCEQFAAWTDNNIAPKGNMLCFNEISSRTDFRALFTEFQFASREPVASTLRVKKQMR